MKQSVRHICVRTLACYVFKTIHAQIARSWGVNEPLNVAELRKRINHMYIAADIVWSHA
jgi:hypothetical protein